MVGYQVHLFFRIDGGPVTMVLGCIACFNDNSYPSTPPSDGPPADAQPEPEEPPESPGAVASHAGVFTS